MVDNFTLFKVSDSKTKKEFLNLPVRLYKKENYWIRPIDDDIESVFDPQKNKLFRNGIAIRWILQENGTTIGRIAAFIDHKTANNNDQPTGGLGFFECINNQEAANLLFDAGKSWLQDHGMEAMDGPVNFGERDRWWGCLVEGFEYEPNYCMPYNFAYYKTLFETYGFQNYFNQLTYYKTIDKEEMDPILEEKAKRVAKNPKYRFEHAKIKEIEKYTEDFRTVYNLAWGKHIGVKSLSKTHANAMIKSLKPILDEQLMWFAYYDKDPIGFFLMIPEINDIMKHLNGKMNLISKVRFMLLKWKGVCDTALGLVFGVVPAHQGKGIEGGMVMAFGDVALRKKFPYKHLELNWIGDFNPTMIKVVEQVGCKVIKIHTTYRYLFDRTKPFERAKIL